MKSNDKVLQLFENNRDIYLSGEDIAARLNISRTAVWKIVKSLKEDGYVIDAVTNKGYRLSSESNILSSVGIHKYLNEENNNIEIDVIKTVSSTNNFIKEKPIHSIPDWFTVVANEQTSGKGRFGRTFFSPINTGIYMSIFLKPKQLKAPKATFITTAAAVAICEAIEKVSDKKPTIKWVNDIFIDDKKICGILTEASFEMESEMIEYVILGIGVNVYCPQNGFPNDIKNTAGFVFEDRQNDVENQLVAEFLNIFKGYYTHIEKKEYIKKYQSRSLVTGKNVNVIFEDRIEHAYVSGIDENCHLLVRYSDGSKDKLSSGEISINF